MNALRNAAAWALFRAARVLWDLGWKRRGVQLVSMGVRIVGR